MMVSMSVKHLSVSLNTHARPSVLSAFVGYGTKIRCDGEVDVM